MLGSIGAAAAALAFLGLGVGAAFAPAAGAEQYGLPVHDATGRAYVRALGARDAVLGLVILALLVRRERSALAAAIALCSLAGAADGAIVARARGRAAWRNLAVHATGTGGLLAVAAVVRGAASR